MQENDARRIYVVLNSYLTFNDCLTLDTEPTITLETSPKLLCPLKTGHRKWFFDFQSVKLL